MPRKSLPGPSRLSKILAELNRAPQLRLTGLKTLKVTLAAKNDHFGARHFVKEELPRIRWANPTLKIDVKKVPKSKDEHWKPEMVLEYTNGKRNVLDLDQKWSGTILKDLMESAGDLTWQQWKAEAAAAGLPVVSGEGLATPKPKAQPLKSSPPHLADTDPSLTTSDSEKDGGVPRSGIAAALP